MLEVKLEKLFSRVLLNKSQKVLLVENFIDLKTKYKMNIEYDFNQKYKFIKSLVKNTKRTTLNLFRKQGIVIYGLENNHKR